MSRYGLKTAAVLGLVLLAAPVAAEQRGEPFHGEEALALGPDVVDVVGAPAGPPVTGAALEAITHDLALEIRCPVCQGQSIADSPAESARHMKRQTHAMLAAGYSPTQVMTYFETSYGEFIRLRPRAEGLNLLVWLLPLVILLLGAIVVWRVVRQKPGADVEAEPGQAPEAPEAPAASGEDTELEPWLARVRDQTRDGDD